MRETAEALVLPASGTVYSLSSVDDGMGGHTQSWTASGTVDCRVDPFDAQSSGGEPVIADRITTTRQVVITTPAETTISATGRFASGGVTYEVVNIRAPRSWELTRRIEGIEVS